MFEVIGAVDVCATREEAGRCGQPAHTRGGSGWGSVSGTPVVIGGTQGGGQAPNGVEGLGVGGHALGDTAAGVEDRRVVAPAEARTDRREGLAGELAREVHGDLTRVRE